MNEIENFVSKLNPDIVKKVQSFAQSAEGQQVIEKFKGMDKDELLKKVGTMSDGEKKKLIDSINKNPDFMNKLKGMK